MAAFPLLHINAELRLQRELISGNAFCVVVDEFLKEPKTLVEYAAKQRAEFARPNIGYPGLQIRVNDDAMADIFRFVRAQMSKEFGFLRGRIGIRSLLSMVTAQPDDLSFMQRICHIDPNPDPGRAKYAALLYLFDDERLGGTGFYRWKNEALVWQGVNLLRKDQSEGEELLKRSFETFRAPPSYMTASNDVAELLYTVQPRFNRFVFYSGDIPHTGAITAPELLSDDPRKGRLTLNLFFSVLSKGDRPHGT
jgi:hypothetical protein